MCRWSMGMEKERREACTICLCSLGMRLEVERLHLYELEDWKVVDESCSNV